jgi:protein-tyrosine phosphatase
MDHKIRQRGLDAETDSCGFESYHVGEGADRRSVEVARKHGISLDSHRARQFRLSDFDEYDRIYVMDSVNYSDVMSVARNGDDESKVDYIMNVLQPGANQPVPDPYYGGKDGFENVYRMLDKACDIIADDIEDSPKDSKTR